MNRRMFVDERFKKYMAVSYFLEQQGHRGSFSIRVHSCGFSRSIRSAFI